MQSDKRAPRARMTKGSRVRKSALEEKKRNAPSRREAGSLRDPDLSKQESESQSNPAMVHASPEPSRHKAYASDKTSSALSPYKPTEEERAYLDKQAKRVARMPPCPRYSFEGDVSGYRLLLDHPDPATGRRLFQEALGTADPKFASGIEPQLIAMTGGDDEDQVANLNWVLSYVLNSRPEDETVATHLIQMVGVHLRLTQSMKSAAQVQGMLDATLKCRSFPSPYKSNDPSELENEKFYNIALSLLTNYNRDIEKLARTASEQLMALARYRRMRAIPAVSKDSPEPSTQTKEDVDAEAVTANSSSGAKVLPLRRKGR